MAPSVCFDTGVDYTYSETSTVPLSSKDYWTSNDAPEDYTPALQVIITQASDWEYLGEGASNVVYRYKGISPIFSSYLLRLRKLLPGSPSTLTLFNSLQNSYIPTLGTDVVCPTILARLAPGVAQQFNDALARMNNWDSAQRRRRHAGEGGNMGMSVIGTGYIDEYEEYATLIQDMSCGQWARKSTSIPSMEVDDYQDGHASDGWMDVALVEFKPRWLSQSADAPSDWNVCRTCAVRAMQDRSNRKKTHHRRCLSGDSGLGMMDDEEEEKEQEGEEDEEEEQYCPLDLSSQDPIRVNRAVRAILYGGAGEVHCTDTDEDLSLAEDLAEVLEDRFTEWLLPGQVGSRIVSRLRRAQEEWGRHGVFTEEPSAVEEVGKAMTVRDCSVFVRVWARWKKYTHGTSAPEVETKFECRVGDLDVKIGKGGGGVYWRNVERRLVGGGWYGKVQVGAERGCRGF